MLKVENMATHCRWHQMEAREGAADVSWYRVPTSMLKVEEATVTKKMVQKKQYLNGVNIEVDGGCLNQCCAIRSETVLIPHSTKLVGQIRSISVDQRDLLVASVGDRYSRPVFYSGVIIIAN